MARIKSHEGHNSGWSRQKFFFLSPPLLCPVRYTYPKARVNMLSLWRQLEFSGQKLNRAQPTDTYARTPQQAVVRASHSLEGISNQVVGVVDGSKVCSSFISLLDVCFLQSVVLLTGQTQFSQIVVRRRILRLLQGGFDQTQLGRCRRGIWIHVPYLLHYLFRRQAPSVV